MNLRAAGSVSDRWLAPLFVMLGISGCLVPPSRFDGGYSSDHRFTGRAGVHVASVIDARIPWDVGAGVVLNAPIGRAVTASGGYLDAAWMPVITPGYRLSIGPGLAVLDLDGRARTAGYLRFGIERFWVLRVGSDDREGPSYGQGAVGAYVEATRPLTDTGVTFIIGVSGRLPAALGRL